MNEALYVIQAPHFTAGIVAVDGVINKTAPILRYMLGWNIDKVKHYVTTHGWTIISKHGLHFTQ